MRTMIDRLMLCGVPEITAVCISNDFERHKKPERLTVYIETMEAEHERNERRD